MRMQSLLLIAWTLLLAAGVPEEAEPGACLLQRSSSEVQRAALVQKGRQDPAHDLGNSNEEGGDAANNTEEGESSDKREEEKEPPAKENDEKQKDEDDKDKDNQDETKKEKDAGKHDKDKKDDEEKHGEHGDKGKKKETDDGEESNELEETPGASLRLELWLPIPISDLKDKDKKGPLPVFLETLQKQFAEAANVSIKRLDMLGVRGEYSDDGVLSFFARDVKASLQDSPVVAEEVDSHSIIDVEVLPATQTEDPSPQDILRVLREELSKEDSSLMKGSLKDTLTGARIIIRKGVEGLLPHDKSGAIRRDLRSVPFFVGTMALLLSAP